MQLGRGRGTQVGSREQGASPKPSYPDPRKSGASSCCPQPHTCLFLPLTGRFPLRALSGQQPEVLGTLVTAVGALLANGSVDHAVETSIHR